MYKSTYFSVNILLLAWVNQLLMYGEAEFTDVISLSMELHVLCLCLIKILLNKMILHIKIFSPPPSILFHSSI